MLNENAGNVLLRRAIRLAIGGGTIAATCGVAQAQQAPAAAPSAENTLAEVVVTGSHISVPNQVSISPITNVTADQIQSVGSTRIEDVLNQLPQVFADQGSNVSNGSNGTSTVNLRGLNTKRTLVLVNGDRLGYWRSANRRRRLRHQHDSDGAGGQHRSGNRRRCLDLRRGRRGGRRELQDQRSFRGCEAGGRRGHLQPLEQQCIERPVRISIISTPAPATISPRRRPRTRAEPRSS